MAVMIAAFVGKNADFQRYLKEQQTIQLARAIDHVQESMKDLYKALPIIGLQRSSFDGDLLQVHVKGLSTLEQIPGIPVVADADPKSEYRYQVSKWFRGVGFYCWATAADIKMLAQPKRQERGLAQ